MAYDRLRGSRRGSSLIIRTGQGLLVHGFTIAPLLLALSASVVSADLRAQGFAQRQAPFEAPTGGDAANALGERDAARIARQRSGGGRVLSVEPATENGQPAYRVKVLTPDGRVRVLSVPAGPSR